MSGLCHSIFAMTTDELRYSYASLTETRLWSALSGTVSDYWAKVSKSGDQEGVAFQRRVADAIQRDRDLPDEEICFRLLAELSAILGIHFPNLVSRKDCADLCERIVRGSSVMYTKYHPGYTGATENELVTAVIGDIVGHVAGSASQSAEKTDDLASKAESFLDTLPANQHEEIRRRLGVDELSKSMLTNMMVKGTIGSVFAVAIDVAGFAAYQHAVILLSSIAGLIGVTLPFVWYTTLTSLIAVVSNPIFLVAFIGGGGILQYNKQDRKVREQFVSVLVAITLAGEDPSRPQSIAESRANAVVDFCHQRLAEHLAFRGPIRDVSTQLEHEQGALESAKERRRTAKEDIQQCAATRAALVGNLGRCIEADDDLMERLVVTGPGQGSAREYRSLKCKLASEGLARLATQERGFQGLLSGAKSGLVRTKLRVQMSRALGLTAKALVDCFPQTVPSGLERYVEESARIAARESEAKSRLDEAEEDVRKREGVCIVLKDRRRELESAQAELGRKLPALVEVASRT